MSNIQQRIDTLLEAAENWLRDDNPYVTDAIDQTVQEGYFGFEDIIFAIQAIEESLTEGAIEDWAEAAGMENNSHSVVQNVLCLHAGNLPLVGFQDAFATLLSGARYTGKISRKDPYLLPTFLNEVKKTSLWSDMDVQWTHRLSDFEDMPHNAIVFAGSESSVPDVKEVVKKYNLANDQTRYLIRTAHFSLAYIDRNDQKTLRELTEGMLRYGGKGCRSVAIVVSPFALNEISGKLRDAVRSFWVENPQHLMPPPQLKQQFAYNEAVERNQLWLDYFLLQEGGLELDQDYVCYWVEGDESTVSELAGNYQQEIQSIYVPNRNTTIPDWQQRTELLSQAQQPALGWRPDGVDTLKWLKS